MAKATMAQNRYQ